MTAPAERRQSPGPIRCEHGRTAMESCAPCEVEPPDSIYHKGCDGSCLPDDARQPMSIPREVEVWCAGGCNSFTTVPEDTPSDDRAWTCPRCTTDGARSHPHNCMCEDCTPGHLTDPCHTSDDARRAR